MDELDNLAYSTENIDDFVLDRAWMEIVKKDACYNTEFEVSMNNVEIDFDMLFNEEDRNCFNPFAKLPTTDFIKKCDFKYNPGKMFNIVIQYD